MRRRTGTAVVCVAGRKLVANGSLSVQIHLWLILSAAHRQLFVRSALMSVAHLIRIPGVGSVGGDLIGGLRLVFQCTIQLSEVCS